MKTEKELKAAYKEMKFRMGVYQIRNLQNNRILVGSSTNLVAIWNRERLQLSLGSHRNAALQKDWHEYGEAGFVYEILDEIKEKEGVLLDYSKEVKFLENMYKAELNPFYN